ncbi:yeti [Augochlora pura]
MTEEHQLPSDSDEDDEDYVPDGADSEPVSEVESEGDAESGPEDENDENKRETTKKQRKKGNRGTKSNVKKHKRSGKDVKADSNEEEKVETEESKEKKKLTEEEEKKKADSLWADFMKDTATVPKSTSQNTASKASPKPLPSEKPKVGEKVKITKVFEFAGEEVKVEKEVSIDSAEARLSLSSAENSDKTGNSAAPAAPAGRGSGRGRGFKRAGLGGISSVLGQIGKKAKISTLEKSKLDWDSYKKEENLEEEISTHNKGKDGYLERQDFLQRADLRQFEIEKQLRNANRRTTR